MTRAAGGGVAKALSPLRRVVDGWRVSDLVIAVATLAIAGAGFRESTTQHELLGRFGPGAGLFPAIVTGAALFVILLFVLQGASRAVRSSWPERDGIRRIVLMVAATALVPTLSGIVGLLTASLLVVAFLLFIVVRAPVLPALLTLTISGGLAYLIFFRLLTNPMPRGPWGYF